MFLIQKIANTFEYPIPTFVNIQPKTWRGLTDSGKLQKLTLNATGLSTSLLN